MLTEHQLKRYDRQIRLQGFGTKGQEILLASKVLVVGVGGLGSVISMNLAAAGVGQIGLVDADTVSLSNLQRQILYRESQEGKPKAQMAALNLRKLNSECGYKVYDTMLSKDNAAEIISDYDIIMDACDNFHTRYLINDTCFALSKPFVYTSISETTGQIALFNPLSGKTSYRTLYPEEERLSMAENPSSAVMGVLPCLAASLASNEAIKYLCSWGENLLDKLLCFDILTNQFRVFDL